MDLPVVAYRAASDWRKPAGFPHAGPQRTCTGLRLTARQNLCDVWVPCPASFPVVQQDATVSRRHKSCSLPTRRRHDTILPDPGGLRRRPAWATSTCMTTTLGEPILTQPLPREIGFPPVRMTAKDDGLEASPTLCLGAAMWLFLIAAVPPAGAVEAPWQPIECVPADLPTEDLFEIVQPVPSRNGVPLRQSVRGRRHGDAPSQRRR
jgi:hypothetical protein